MTIQKALELHRAGCFAQAEARLLAQAPVPLAALRDKLAAPLPPFDAARPARALESAYQALAEKACWGQKPAGFSVNMPAGAPD